MSNEVFQNWHEIPGKSLADKVFLRQTSSDRVLLNWAQFGAGTAVPLHSHSNEIWVQCLSGRGTFRTDNAEYSLVPGCVVNLPAGIAHSASFVEETVLLETHIDPPELTAGKNRA